MPTDSGTGPYCSQAHGRPVTLARFPLFVRKGETRGLQGAGLTTYGPSPHSLVFRCKHILALPVGSRNLPTAPYRPPVFPPLAWSRRVARRAPWGRALEPSRVSSPYWLRGGARGVPRRRFTVLPTKRRSIRRGSNQQVTQSQKALFRPRIELTKLGVSNHPSSPFLFFLSAMGGTQWIRCARTGNRPASRVPAHPSH